MGAAGVHTGHPGWGAVEGGGPHTSAHTALRRSSGRNARTCQSRPASPKEVHLKTLTCCQYK